MAYIVNLLYHLRCVRDVLPSGATASIDVESCRLRIDLPYGSFDFVAQFVGRRDGKLIYSPDLQPGSRGFIGWLPYFNRRWPAAVDKLEFKAACQAFGVPTPDFWLDHRDVVRDYIVKKSRSSFGLGIVGPFRAEQSVRDGGVDESGAYFEEFKVGTMAKIWYWGAQPVCMEARAMPALIGDGRKTLAMLLSDGRIGTNLGGNEEIYRGVFAWQGRALDYVPADGEKVLADFRIGSPLLPQPLDDTNVWQQYKHSDVGRRVFQLGKRAVLALPEAFRKNTLYTIDAIVTEDDEVWALEMNCNPMVHPAVYRKMIPAAIENTTVPSRPSLPVWRYV